MIWVAILAFACAQQASQNLRIDELRLLDPRHRLVESFKNSNSTVNSPEYLCLSRRKLFGGQT